MGMPQPTATVVENDVLVLSALSFGAISVLSFMDLQSNFCSLV